MTLREAMERVKKSGEMTHTCKNGVVIAAQRANGRSRWARWVREGFLKPTDVYWAFTFQPWGREWLGILLDRGKGNGKFFDLRNKEQKKAFQELENQTALIFLRRKKTS